MIVRQVRVVLSPDKPHYPDKLRYVTMLPNDWQLRISHIMIGLCVTAQTKNVTSPVGTEYRPCYHPGYVNIMSVLCPRLPSSSVCVHHSFCTVLARRSLKKKCHFTKDIFKFLFYDNNFLTEICFWRHIWQVASTGSGKTITQTDDDTVHSNICLNEPEWINNLFLVEWCGAVEAKSRHLLCAETRIYGFPWTQPGLASLGGRTESSSVHRGWHSSHTFVRDMTVSSALLWHYPISTMLPRSQPLRYSSLLVAGKVTSALPTVHVLRDNDAGHGLSTHNTEGARESSGIRYSQRSLHKQHLVQKKKLAFNHIQLRWPLNLATLHTLSKLSFSSTVSNSKVIPNSNS